jgi:glycosyltransferase involved in cell wall biosynthesis
VTGRRIASDSPRSLVTGLRVAAVLCGFDLGGSERQAILLARELAARGALVQVWGLFEPSAGPASQLCDIYSIPWRAMGLQWDRGVVPDGVSLGRLCWRLRQARIDVLLPFTIYPNVICGAMWRASRASLCVWNQREDGVYRMPRRLERWAVRQTPLFISNSRHGATFLMNSLNVASPQIVVVPNAVELRPPLAGRRDWRERLGIGATTFVACMIANFRRVKDHTTLLHAWRLVVDRLPTENPPILLLAGRPDQTAGSVETLIRSLDLSRAVVLLGPTDDVTGLLLASDVFVFTSHSEGLPNAVLEAMAAGLPIVATDLPGTREAVGREGQKQLCPPSDAGAFADVVVKMASDFGWRVSAGAGNRRRALERFDLTQTVEAYIDGMASTGRLRH